MKRRTFIASIGTLLIGAATVAEAQPAAPRGRGWGAAAEKEFALGRGMAPRLMTEDEWKEHQAKMRTLKGAELDAYRQETHKEMVERAKARGIAMPGAGAAGRGRGER
jgi:hypothetical protein